MSTMTKSAASVIPKHMKAAVMDRFGGLDVVHTAILPVPELEADEVLIRVVTAGVGVWDPEIVSGEFDVTGGRLPRILGSDGSGIVVAAGPRVRRHDLNDRVYGWGLLNPKGGFFAEYVAISEEEVELVPPTLTIDEAGALAVDGLTALAGLDLLGTDPDQLLMIIGASGGVGHLALQLAKRLRARVLAIASRADGVELPALRLGADDALDGHTGDVTGLARAFAPEGVDAALVLAPAAAGLLDLVRPGGRIAYPHGVAPEPSQRSGVRVEGFDGYHGHEALDRLDALIAKGSFHVEVSREYPLDRTPDALRDLKRHHLGKLAVRVHSS